MLDWLAPDGLPSGESAASARLGARERWDPLGPRPRMALVLCGSYAAIGVVLALRGVVSAFLPGERGLGWFCGWIALSCGGMAYGVSRLRSWGPKRPASAWVLASLVPHVLAGALGAATVVIHGISPARGSFGETSLFAAAIALFGGCIPACVPAYLTRRGAALLLAALGGPASLWCAAALASLFDRVG